MRTVVIGGFASLIASLLGAFVYALFFGRWELWASVVVIAFPVSCLIGISLSGFATYLLRKLNFFEILLAGAVIGGVCGIILVLVHQFFYPFGNREDLFVVLTYWVLVGALFGGLYSISFFFADKLLAKSTK